MKAEALLIDHPRGQGTGRRTLFTLLTLLAWMAWFSLWLPLITLVAWSFGARATYVELIMHRHSGGWVDLLVVLIIGLVTTLIALLWSRYNYQRFHLAKRRQGAAPIALAAMAHKLEVATPLATQLRQARRSQLEFTTDGRVLQNTPTLDQ
ncbi:MAG: poly-beta-1,6-N-acetyl-D-glucosamine biosynthesis protein PgaD [Dyella sp.]